MIKAEKVNETGISISVIGKADDTMTEAAAVIETIVAGCIEKHGDSFGRESYFEIIARAAAFIEEKTGVDVTDPSIDIEKKAKENPIELLNALFRNAGLADGEEDDDSTEDDVPDYLF